MSVLIAAKKALEIVLENTIPLQDAHLRLQETMGYVLNENLYADRPFPPYNRVAMDGIAIAYEVYAEGQRTFTIEDVGAAGSPQKTLQQKDACIEIMTGAILPNGTDTVIRYEDLIMDGKSVTIDANEIKAFQNVHHKGSDQAQNDLLIPKGKRIAAPEIGVAATIGKTQLAVKRLPTFVVVSTGDELVNIDRVPQPYQIRKSNSLQLQALFQSWGITADTYHLADDKSIIERQLYQLMDNYDVVVLSGGVSKGKYDHVPSALKVLGVQKRFHRVAQRPGKPFWFGKKDRHTAVFALPGNPVSSFMCAIRYIRPWLDACQGIVPHIEYALLGENISFKPDLTYYMQVQVSCSFDGTLIAMPIQGGGSGDLANMLKTNAFMELPQGKNEYVKGEIYPIFRYR